MADPLSAARALEALRAEGLKVVQHGSWRTHNRGSRGTGWGPLNGVMIHHTAGNGVVDDEVGVCYRGRSDLPGPLCHGVIDKHGDVHMVGWGRANHAGLGDDDVLRAVIAERSLPVPNERNTDGNSRFYGFECINRGDGEDPWPEAQLDAIERAAAALCRAHGWGARSVIGHLEWTSWKVDPRGFSMDDMRARIATRLEHHPDYVHEEDPMAGYSKEDIARAVIETDGVHDVPKRWRGANQANAHWKLQSVNEFIGDRVLDNSDALKALEAKVDALGDAGGITAEQVQAAAQAGARAALAELGKTLTDQEA